MREEDYNLAVQKLDRYMESNGHRRTPERYEVLRILYSFSTRVTFTDIEAALEEDGKFYVSKSTIYNCLKLFIELGLVRCTRVSSQSFYDIEYQNNACLQVCRVCGKTTQLPPAKMDAIKELLHLRRFAAEAYTLRVDGICASCKAVRTRMEKRAAKKQVEQKPQTEKTKLNNKTEKVKQNNKNKKQNKTEK